MFRLHRIYLKGVDDRRVLLCVDFVLYIFVVSPVLSDCDSVTY